MSIVRMGMAEDGKFADGYEAIFGKGGAKKPAPAAKPAAAKAAEPAKPEPAKKKPDAKK